MCFLQPSFVHAAERELRADGQSEVSLCGILRHELRWGPPGFGENPKEDTKFTVWFISFKKPRSFSYVGEHHTEHKESLSEIQLSPDLQNIRKVVLMQLTGKHVVVKGKLWPATSEGDITAVVLALAQQSNIKVSHTPSDCP